MVSSCAMLRRTSFKVAGARSGKRLCKSGLLTAPYLQVPSAPRKRAVDSNKRVV